jgi:N-acetylglucosaminyldiphosphoundecaprenol N-acetyl-beta-D-mannosaminyltransferase
MGVTIDSVDIEEAVERTVATSANCGLLQVCTVNLDFLAHANSDPGVGQIFRRSGLNLADGAAVVWLARLLGHRLPGRVTGADMVPRLAEASARGRCRLFLLGGEDGAAVEAARRLEAAYPGLRIAGTFEPPRAAVFEMANEEILRRIADSGADTLLVAFGHPKEEYWIDAHRDQLTVKAAIGLGCCFDLIADRRRRAPVWMRCNGLEWVFRSIQEPRRLVSRYVWDGCWSLGRALPVVIAQRSGNPT